MIFNKKKKKNFLFTFIRISLRTYLYTLYTERSLELLDFCVEITTAKVTPLNLSVEDNFSLLLLIASERLSLVARKKVGEKIFYGKVPNSVLPSFCDE